MPAAREACAMARRRLKAVDVDVEGWFKVVAVIGWSMLADAMIVVGETSTPPSPVVGGPYSMVVADADSKAAAKSL
eukprot:6353448-Prymnesium_polylepis.1